MQAAIAARPKVELSLSPDKKIHSISSDVVMPDITVTASLKDVVLQPYVRPTYHWTVSLGFNGVFKGLPVSHYQPHNLTSHPPMVKSGYDNSFKIPFTQIRGGLLTIKVKVMAGAAPLTAETKEVYIAGSNPTKEQLAEYVNANIYFRKLIQHESSQLHFLANGMPQFSHDDKGGVGFCQLTHPAPTEDQIWSWKANIDGGWNLWLEKERVAGQYPARVRTSREFTMLVQKYNQERVRQAAAAARHNGPQGQPGGQPAEVQVQPRELQISLPDYNQEQLALDTLRGFNGYVKPRRATERLHEFWPAMNANRTDLVVQVNDAQGLGTVLWERVPVEQRPTDSGDPNYVENVLRQCGF